MDIFTNNGLIMTIFVLRAQPITFYAASQLVQPKYLGYTVAAVFPLGMPKSRDLFNLLLPGFFGNSNPGIFLSRDN